ncbi:hypothetical protein HPB51_025032 [Rhipicephalus microplus]|uniref:Uncharacterized protein n=1 Tax=Rhipicephalus microplus TaxID=6941 RepID=A0A9J6DDH6_RHIMP|nr:hypothetical protein HPB51_025032 [Rhipicephalus microplus]
MGVAGVGVAFVTQQKPPKSDCTDSLPLEGQPDPSVWSAVEEAFGSQQFSDYVAVDDDLVSSEQLAAQDVCRLLRFCLDNTYFVFNKKYLKQVFGTAMGAPVSVVRAKIALEDLECAALSSFVTRL